MEWAKVRFVKTHVTKYVQVNLIVNFHPKHKNDFQYYHKYQVKIAEDSASSETATIIALGSEYKLPNLFP